MATVMSRIVFCPLAFPFPQDHDQVAEKITDDGILRISGQGMIPNEMHPWLKTPEDFETWEEYDKYREKKTG